MIRQGRRAVGAGLLVVATGVAAGLGGAAVALVLHLVQHTAWGYEGGTFLEGVLRAPVSLRVVALGVAGAVGGVGWWALRRFGRPAVPVEAAVQGVRMPGRETVAGVVLQLAVVGFGGSIGRELAPRLLGALAADRLSGRFAVSPRLRRCLIACGAGAGLAAVYDVPLGGALFALETLLGDLSPGLVAAAVTTSGIATLVARIVVPAGSLYTVGAIAPTPSLLVCALVVGPLIGLAGVGFDRLVRAARDRRAHDRGLLVAMPAVFLAVGLLALLLPQILGNGRALAQTAFALGAPAGLLLLLALVKAAATIGTVAAGADGGTLTPSVAVGAALGAAAGSCWSLAWPGVPPAAGALVGAAAFLAAAMRAPLTGAVLVLEFAGASLQLALPVFLAVAGASGVRRLLARRHAPEAAAPPPAAGRDD